MVFGYFDAVENGWFIVVQILAHLVSSGISEELFEIFMKILVLVPMEAMDSLRVKISNSSFVRMKFVMGGELCRCVRLVDLLSMMSPES